MNDRSEQPKKKIRIVPLIFGIICCILAIACVVDGSMEACFGAVFVAVLLFIFSSKPPKQRIHIQRPPSKPKNPEKKIEHSNAKDTDVWEENAGCPFSYEIPEKSRFGVPLSYKYTDVLANICGDVSHLKPGAVVYAGYSGEFCDVARNHIATIENAKLRSMISDYLYRGETITARVMSIDEKLHINIGFYREPYSWKYDDDEEDEEENEDFEE